MADGEALLVRVLRVFTDADGRSGNPLGIVRDAGAVEQGRRQQIATELGYSETVFVEDGARLQIFTPATELPFAGHPLVGCAWLLHEPLLRPPAGDVPARAQDGRAWITARPEWTPRFDRVELASPADVDAFEVPDHGSVQVWAWQDEGSGAVRARVFAPELGVAEDPATGSASIALCAALRRPLTIEQGPGCRIECRPLPDGTVELGGMVADDGERALP